MSFLRRFFQGKPRPAAEVDEPYDDETAGYVSSSLDLIAIMETDGVDLGVPRAVTHLFLGDDADLMRASKILISQGRHVLENGDGRLVVGEETAVSEAWVNRVVPVMCQTAGEFGLTYDGWDVDVASDRDEKAN